MFIAYLMIKWQIKTLFKDQITMCFRVGFLSNLFFQDAHEFLIATLNLLHAHLTRRGPGKKYLLSICDIPICDIPICDIPICDILMHDVLYK